MDIKNAITAYMSGIISLAGQVEKTQSEKMESAARLCADCVINGGMIYLFGTGHSHILAEEVFYRAGGLARVYPILDDPLMLHTAAARSSEMERLPGYAKLLLDNIDTIKPGDVMFVFSNSGRNTAAVEMALEAAVRGLHTVCVTNLAHGAVVASRHPSGKKLPELCEVVIDNCGCVGDAMLDTGAGRAGATSTAIGAMIMQAIHCRTVELCCEAGTPPEIFSSANVNGGDEANAAMIAKYKKIVKCL